MSLSIFGLALESWGLQTLGRFYSADVVIYQSRRFLAEGPYKFVRHPIYAGGLLVTVGMGLAVQSWAAILIILLGVAIIPYRIAIEEKVLISEFGEQYVSYSRRVKQLIPLIY
ncbi:MAG: isoprenylcysteine carboxylmethyltransferase family protein [archaeon]|nr:isoprenylcysteine carboxylmethyltransferase family protein [archaeon]